MVEKLSVTMEANPAKAASDKHLFVEEGCGMHADAAALSEPPQTLVHDATRRDGVRC